MTRSGAYTRAALLRTLAQIHPAVNGFSGPAPMLTIVPPSVVTVTEHVSGQSSGQVVTTESIPTS
jgi:hypothetical protein